MLTMLKYKENNKNGNELITKNLLKTRRNELAIGIEPEIIKK